MAIFFGKFGDYADKLPRTNARFGHFLCEIRTFNATALKYELILDMPISNTSNQFGSVSKILHWLTVILIFVTIPLAWYAAQLPNDSSEQVAKKLFAFSLHKTFGITALGVAIFRILWAVTQTAPNLVGRPKHFEISLAAIVHWLLYFSIISVPLTGWIHHAASTGYAPILWPFSQNLIFVPKDPWTSELFAGFHHVTKFILLAAVGLHIAGALKHHYINKDATLLRMLPRNPSNFPTSQRPKWIKSFSIAVAVWLASLGVGGFFGAYPTQFSHEPETAQTGKNSDWTVTKGDLRISVTQGGSQILGEFADWTSTISFDPDATEGVVGAVKVEIATSSLTLGTITEQAISDLFLDSKKFPTAHFQADIIRNEAGYRAIGSLTVRDTPIDISLPLTLLINQNVTDASGKIIVQRLDFGVGPTFQGESFVGHAVEINFSLTATVKL